MSASLERTGPDPDRALADQIVGQGDEGAFRLLYRRHTPRLLQMVLRLLGGDHMAAEDVVQETWVQAVRQLGRFRWEARFDTWLCAIGLNQARDHLRRERRRQPVDDPAALEGRVAAPPIGERIDLEQALSRLPEGYRTVVVLHDVEGRTHDEIGQLLGVSAGTSKSQLFHARRALRGLLAPARET